MTTDTQSTTLNQPAFTDLGINDVETSETFLSGVSLGGGVDSVRSFLTNIFRGVIDMLASIFGGGGRSSDSAVSIPSASNKNQTFYRISLGPKKSTSLADVPKISPVT